MNEHRFKTTAKAVFVIGAIAAFGLSCLQQGKKEAVVLTSAETPDPVAQRVSTKDFDKFDHSIKEHKQFDCTSCHRREGKSLKMDLPGHESCIGCHLNQFTSVSDKTSAVSPMCAICHQDTKSTDPPVKAFPVKFQEGFNMKFNHAAHDNGEGRPAGGCAACHNPSGPGMTIPINYQAHNDCFGCHTAESKIGACSVCHQLAPYSRTVQSQYSFQGKFTHGDHRAMGCGECHSVVAGAPNSRQVTNISISEHHGRGNNCAMCHDGRRSFSGDNFSACVRCHGNKFAALPPNNVTSEQPAP